MGNDVEVRDSHNLIIGWVKDVGDRLIATHIRKGYVGSYTKSSDITTDGKGNIYCFGNGCSSIIREVNNE